jgi:hypothetical protein
MQGGHAFTCRNVFKNTTGWHPYFDYTYATFKALKQVYKRYGTFENANGVENLQSHCIHTMSH